MCGIAGIVELGERPASESALKEMCRLLAHRGPDGSGYWFSPNRAAALGHRRLAILDLDPRSDQPMISADGRYVVVFNGEIYNFLELRAELIARGETFHTESDTEVLLAAWRVWGEGMLPRFNGMWALAIYDCETRALFLSRDRFGIKPLLYSFDGQRFVFASELSAIVSCGVVDSRLNLDVARRVLIDPFGIEGSEETLFASVRRLQAGHCMTVRQQGIKVRRWWSTLENLPEVPRSADDRVAKFAELFRDAVAIRMRSDVPIGTSLSGGFDSSAVLCTMAAIERDGMGPRGATGWRHAFVASFPGLGNDERPFAEMAAKWAGVSPTIIEIGQDDVLGDADQALQSLDDVYIGLPTAVWRLYREMRRKGVVVSLDGHGADEAMGAYSQAHQQLWFKLRNLMGWVVGTDSMLDGAIDFGRAVVLERKGQLFLRHGVRDMPQRLPLLGDGDRLPGHWGGLNRRLYRMFHGTILPTILRNFDRLSMAHGIEVRMPFLDWRLVTYTMALPDKSKNRGGLTKVIARDAMKGKMPETIRVQRLKVGFNSPMPTWLNGALNPWVQAVLARRVPAFEELVDESALRAAVERLGATQAWGWHSAGRVWPYLHLKWLLGRLDEARAAGKPSEGKSDVVGARTLRRAR
jgi:asparagine synthase (glutamine-hydrolysing)